MKIVNAVWEKRNLGLNVFEVEIDQKDDFDQFLSEENSIILQDTKYIVVKTPVNLPEFIWNLPNRGYNFVETNFLLSLKKKNYKVPKFIEKLDRNVKVTWITDENKIDGLLSNYEKEMFDTDRISIDPFFGKELSANRYLKWTQDMLEKGCKIFEVNIEMKKIGFFIVKQVTENTAYPVLAGLYPEFKNKGLGPLLIKKCIEVIWELGFENISTSIVSNNLSIIKIHLCYGFEITNLTYTYVKHLE